MVTFTSNELIPASEFAKKFGSFLNILVSKKAQKLAILKNNKIEAVVISKERYESMENALKEYEAKKFITSLTSGFDDLKKGKTYAIDELWDDLDD